MPVVKNQSPRRAHILASAGEVFLKHGFAGASMSEIATAVGGSKGTLYSYFSSKEEIFEEFMAAEIRQRAQLVFDLPHHTDDIAGVLADLGRRYLRLITEPLVGRLLRIAVHEADRFPEIGRVFNESGPRAAKRMLAEYLDSAMKAGKLAVDDTFMAAEQFMMLCQARVMQDFLFGISTSPSEAQIAEAVDSGVALFMKATRP